MGPDLLLYRLRLERLRQRLRRQRLFRPANQRGDLADLSRLQHCRQFRPPRLDTATAGTATSTRPVSPPGPPTCNRRAGTAPPPGPAAASPAHWSASSSATICSCRRAIRCATAPSTHSRIPSFSLLPLPRSRPCPTPARHCPATSPGAPQGKAEPDDNQEGSDRHSTAIRPSGVSTDDTPRAGRTPLPVQRPRYRLLNCRSSGTECHVMHNHYGGAAALQSQPERRLSARSLCSEWLRSGDKPARQLRCGHWPVIFPAARAVLTAPQLLRCQASQAPPSCTPMESHTGLVRRTRSGSRCRRRPTILDAARIALLLRGGIQCGAPNWRSLRLPSVPAAAWASGCRHPLGLFGLAGAESARNADSARWTSAVQ